MRKLEPIDAEGALRIEEDTLHWDETAPIEKMMLVRQGHVYGVHYDRVLIEQYAREDGLLPG